MSQLPDAVPDAEMTGEEAGRCIDSAVPLRAYHSERVVGLGGSAGSIQALQRFFEALPEAPGMAFIVVLHLSPEHESTLAELLQRCSTLPVEQAQDGQRIELDHVYVIPPAKHLTVVENRLRVSALVRSASGRHTTIDLFFRSLADSHGPHAVAVVLSGGDGDGALGIKRIKERGGLTIAQDPEAAEHAGMPRAAIATNMVDWVLRAEEIPPRLVEYHAREQRLEVPPESGPNPAVPERPTASEHESILREVLMFLRARTGRDFSYYKRATIVRRIARRMQVNGVDTLPEYLGYLRTHPGEAGALLQDLLISVTNFFRDREAFEALTRLIPELFKDKSSADTVRVWVPACATGEEAYSIAILLAEHARTLDAPPALQIFATDLDQEVLAEARSGLYAEGISADISPERLERYFNKEHAGYRVSREIREMLLFAAHDLLKDSPFSRLDLVSCRNLLIYLNRGAQHRAFDIFHFALRPEGYLFLGTSELVDDDSLLFSAIHKKHRIYMMRGAARTHLPVPSGPSTLARALSLQERADGGPVIPRSTFGGGLPASASRGKRSDQLSWSEVHLKLIEHFGPPSLVVSADYDILHLSESAAPFLQFGGGEPSTNLLHTVHPALRAELRAALFRTRQSGQPTAAHGLPIELQGEQQVVDVQVAPVNDLGMELLLVTLAKQANVDAAQPRLPVQDEPAVRHLERELEETKRSLRDVVEQHEASTEELKASNEELQAMNEELRSATEELETSREELQSINEELTTVNQELKSKVDELGHANSDLHNLMGATAIATVFLDRELCIMRFTPPAVELFSIIISDVGRPLSDLQHKLNYPELLADAARVLQQLVPIEREVSESGGRSFLVRMRPYRTTDDRIAGVVLTFVDVSERQLAKQAAQQAKQELEQRVQQRTAQLDAVIESQVTKHQAVEKARQALQRLLISAQEDERGRMSRELHDEAGQQISALLLAMKAIEAAEPSPELAGKLSELRAAAERVGQEIHQLAFQLRPLALDELGLSRALTGFVDAWLARTGVHVDLVTAGIEEERLPTEIETTIYRVVQEAMNNVYRHAAATNVSVSVARRGNQIVTIVEDDGRGFDMSALPQNGQGLQKIGIVGMRERAELVNGELAVESIPEVGTTVRLKLPIPT